MMRSLVTDARVTREDLLALRDRPVHVIGAASAEGAAVLRLLLALGFENLTVHDQRARAELRRAFRTTHGAYGRLEQDQLWEQLAPVYDQGCYGDRYLETIGEAEMVVLGQGWYLDPTNRAAITASVPAAALVTSMTELYFSLHRGPIAGITGTNGKSTTVALTDHLLTVSGVEHRTAGNERSSKQFLPEIEEVPSGTWAVLEVSNRQLLQTRRSPHVAAITSLTPDHLEEHGGFDGYAATKASLFTAQTAVDVAIANADDEHALRAAQHSPAAAANRLVRCGIGDHPAPSVCWRDGVLVAEDMPLHGRGSSSDRRGAPVRSGTVIVATSEDVRMPGEHNQRNVAVAVATALACGADPNRIAQGLRTFEGASLRLEHLDTLDGVDVWSDLKSTTPEATIAALRALSGRCVQLVAGGDDKGLDYAPLAREIAESAGDVRVLLVPGSASDSLARELDELGSAPEFVDDLDSALDRAFDAAASGDVVIVSPAAAGFWTSQLQGGASLRARVRRRSTSPPQEVPPS